MCVFTLALLGQSCSPSHQYRRHSKNYPFNHQKRKICDFMDRGDYLGAALLLEKYDAKGDLDPEEEYWKAQCYFEMGYPHESYRIMSRLLEDQPEAEEEWYFLAGRSAHKLSRFKEAYSWYQDFWTVCQDPDMEEITFTYIEETVNGILYSQGNDAYILEELPHINSSYSDYRPVYNPGSHRIDFTSLRPGELGSEDYDAPLGMDFVSDLDFSEDVYTAVGFGADLLTTLPVDKRFRGPGNDAVLDYSPDGTKAYVYDDRGNGDIALRRKENGKWGPLEKIDGLNSPYNESSFHLLGSGFSAILVSDRPGGQGGKDLYLVTMLADRTWSDPVNLGPVINSPADEESPCISPDGNALFFASKGHDTMGGYDLFVSYKEADGSWGEPQNMGSPVNSGASDLFPEWSPDKEGFYMASDRSGTMGLFDLYYVKMNSTANEFAMTK